MSEYNNFLKHFNRLKNKGEGSEREDIIPVNPGLAAQQEKAPEEKTEEQTPAQPVKENTADETSDTVNMHGGAFTVKESTEENISEEKTEDIPEKTEYVPNQRFIKTNSTII